MILCFFYYIGITQWVGSAKYENIYLQEYKTIRELKNGVNEYIEFYNHRRFHQTLKYKKPMEIYNLKKEKEVIKLAA